MHSFWSGSQFAAAVPVHRLCTGPDGACPNSWSGGTLKPSGYLLQYIYKSLFLLYIYIYPYIRFLYIYRVCPSQFATGRIEDEHYLGGRPATTRPKHHYPLSPGTGTYPIPKGGMESLAGHSQ